MTLRKNTSVFSSYGCSASISGDMYLHFLKHDMCNEIKKIHQCSQSTQCDTFWHASCKSKISDHCFLFWNLKEWSVLNILYHNIGRFKITMNDVQTVKIFQSFCGVKNNSKCSLRCEGVWIYCAWKILFKARHDEVDLNWIYFSCQAFDDVGMIENASKVRKMKGLSGF